MTTQKIQKKKCTCSKLSTAKNGSTEWCPCVEEGLLHTQMVGHCMVCGGQANCVYMTSVPLKK
jgi:hypothetical protein